MIRVAKSGACPLQGIWTQLHVSANAPSSDDIIGNMAATMAPGFLAFFAVFSLFTAGEAQGLLECSVCAVSYA